MYLIFFYRNSGKRFLKSFLKLILFFTFHKNSQLYFNVLFIFLLLKNHRLFYYLNFNKNLIESFLKMFKIFKLINLHCLCQKSLKIHFYLHFNKFIHCLIKVSIFLNFLDKMLQIMIFYPRFNLKLKIPLNSYYFFLF